MEQETSEAVVRLPLSPLASRIVEIAKNEKAPIQSLAEIIAGDSQLAARLIRVANFTSDLPQRLTSVVQTINTLGLENVKCLALGLTVFPFESSVVGTDAGQIECPITLQQLWEHTLGCAVLAGRFGAILDHSSRHRFFAAGFLHDIGRVLLFRYWREHWVEALLIAQDKHIPTSEAEKLACGRDHMEIGELWARTAEIDPILQCAIRSHALNLGAVSELRDEERQLVSVVQLADSVCENFAIGTDGNEGLIADGLGSTLGIRPEEHREQIQNIKQEIECSREFFGFHPGQTKELERRVRRMVKRGGGSGRRELKGETKGRVIPFPTRTVCSGAGEKNREKKLTILVVEDHGSLCDMLSLYFMRYGYHVRTAHDGQTALEIISAEEIHLVLLDLMLPRVDGFTVLRHMRQAGNQKQPYVIVVSAGASAKDRNRVLELGANEYMPKPFHLIRLLERIQNVEKYLLG